MKCPLIFVMQFSRFLQRLTPFFFLSLSLSLFVLGTAEQQVCRKLTVSLCSIINHAQLSATEQCCIIIYLCERLTAQQHVPVLCTRFTSVVLGCGDKCLLSELVWCLYQFLLHFALCLRERESVCVCGESALFGRRRRRVGVLYGWLCSALERPTVCLEQVGKVSSCHVFIHVHLSQQSEEWESQLSVNAVEYSFLTSWCTKVRHLDYVKHSANIDTHTRMHACTHERKSCNHWRENNLCGLGVTEYYFS